MATQKIIDKCDVEAELLYQLALARQKEYNKYDTIRSLGRTIPFLSLHQTKNLWLLKALKKHLDFKPNDLDTIEHLIDFWNIYWCENYIYQIISEIVYRAEPKKSLTPKRTASIIGKILKSANS